MTAPWSLELHDRENPEPGVGEVLVQITATGICGSDVHGFTGENGRRHPGQVMGHETVGVVLDVGPDVEFAPSTGTVVTVNPVIGCGECPQCGAGQPQQCARRSVIGVDPTISSAFAERMTAPASNVVAMPALGRASLGALVEPLAVGYHAARRASITVDDAVLVIGGGPIGQAVALGVNRLGHDRVVVSEPVASRRQLLQSLGMATVDPSSGKLSTIVGDALGGSPTVVIDAVGHSATLTDALTVSTLGARVVLVGMHTPLAEIPAYAISTEERTLIGSFCYTPVEFAETAAWVENSPIDLATLVDEEVPMHDGPDAFRGLADGSRNASKVLVRFDVGAG